MAGSDQIGVLTVNGGGTVDLQSDVTTSDAVNGQTYTTPIVLSSTVTLKDTAGGPIWFKGAAATVDAQTGGVQGLTAITNGKTEFDAAVGTTPLRFLDVHGDTLPASGVTDLNGGSVITKAFGQTYENPVTLTADTILSDSANGKIWFQSTVDSDALLTPRSLTVNTGGTDAVTTG